ncbi:MAG: hypothetical protein LBN33_02865, partial [Desulfovibrio sp.]|nr:hypothetical protein [Desulfovibrio sp.]
MFQFSSMLWYRPGIKWSKGMTEERAKIYAADYDERQYRRSLMERGGALYGLPGTVAGFFAGMLGNLPDPVNLVGFTGGLAASVKAATRAGKVARGAAFGALEGAVSNAAVDLIVLPDLEKRGDDIKFADYALDMVFGAALGGLLGGAGGWLGSRVHKETGLSATEVARMNIPQQDRRVLLDTFEVVKTDAINGDPVNVLEIRGAPEAIARAYDSVRDNPTGGPADEVMAVLSSPEFERIVLERGAAAFDKDGNIVIRGSLIKDMGFDRAGFGLVKIIWRHGEKNGDTRPDASIFRVTKEDVLSLSQILEGYAPVTTGRGGKSNTWVIDGGNGTRL